MWGEARFGGTYGVEVGLPARGDMRILMLFQYYGWDEPRRGTSRVVGPTVPPSLGIMRDRQIQRINYYIQQIIFTPVVHSESNQIWRC